MIALSTGVGSMFCSIVTLNLHISHLQYFSLLNFFSIYIRQSPYCLSFTKVFLCKYNESTLPPQTLEIYLSIYCNFIFIAVVRRLYCGLVGPTHQTTPSTPQEVSPCSSRRKCKRVYTTTVGNIKI